ncbi:MAG: response regulator [Actinomycetota bacterium]
MLVVDDEPQIRRALSVGLRGHGHEVVPAARGSEGLEIIATGGIDAVILDLGLPDLDGVEILRRLRGWSEVPVIILSVRAAQDDKVRALDAGADDYVEKPFGMGELLARIRAVLRRVGGDREPGVLAFEGLEVDLARQLVRRDGERVPLTPTQYRVLEAMVTNPGKLLTHQWLLRRVWGPGYGQESEYLRTYVRQLRRKLSDDPTHPRWIATEPGLGYRWLKEPR